MKYHRFLPILLASMLALTAQATPKVKLGVEVLRERGFDLLRGKRVGLITNPTGVDSRLRSTIDLIHAEPTVRLVALFGPEHGVRGDVHAGDQVAAHKDPKTGVPVYSLYGATRKPTPEMLEGIDILVYDIQDIGCRSFTYISTMGLAMEAAAEKGIPFVVLDRPNPLGGHRIEGSLVEPGYVSFVSQYPIPYVYGLTAGELASYLNSEGLIGAPCELIVVAMQGWTREMIYEDTGLPWVAPSPHIPSPRSALFYPISGILGELGIVSIGVGYTLPFQAFAAEGVDADRLASSLNALRLPGVLFRPIHYKPFYGTGQGKTLQGVQVHLIDPHVAPLSPIQFMVVEELYRQMPDHPIFSETTAHRFSMFDKVCGSDRIRLKFGERYRWSDIQEYWSKDLFEYYQRASRYFMY